MIHILICARRKENCTLPYFPDDLSVMTLNFITNNLSFLSSTATIFPFFTNMHFLSWEYCSPMSRCSTNVVIMRRVILSSFIQAARARFAVSFSVILISQKIVISYLSCANIKEFCRTFVYRFIQLF